MTFNRMFVMANNKVLYFSILFISFVVALRFMPWIGTQVDTYVPYEQLKPLLKYVATYLVAIHILPEIGFYLSRQFSEEH